MSGDTIRLGVPFRFHARIQGEGNVEAVGVTLEWGIPFDTGEQRVLFKQQLGAGPGTYEIEREVTIDSLQGVKSLGDLGPGGYFVVGAYGEVRYADCGGVGGSWTATYSEVFVVE